MRRRRIPDETIIAREGGRTAKPDKVARVALAVAVGCRTVRQVAKWAGVGLGTAYLCLKELRAQGVVDWEPKHSGTLHPAVGFVTVTPYKCPYCIAWTMEVWDAKRRKYKTVPCDHCGGDA